MIDKAVIFDLDHTLGDFYILRLLWKFLQSIDVPLDKHDFFNLCDIYPKVFRPNIFTILKYLNNKKGATHLKLILYTNNQVGKWWLNVIMEYIDLKIKERVFDSLIGPYKISGEIVEKCRTKEYKSYHDVIKCTKLPKNAEILFLDDQYYSKMNHKKVEYYKIKYYFYNEDAKYIVENLKNKSSIVSKISPTFRISFFEKLHRYLSRSKRSHMKTEDEFHIDRVVSKMMMIHIQKFLNKPNKNTRKIKK